MNFLAHIQLSGNTSDLLAGNFLGDFVSKKDFEKLKTLLWFRAEERFLDGVDTMSLRGRVRTGINYPISSDKKWSIDFFNEVFFPEFRHDVCV